MIPTTAINAAMLAEPAVDSAFGSLVEAMGSHSHDSRFVCPANFALFEEEVDTPQGPPLISVDTAEFTASIEPFRQPAEQTIKIVQVLIRHAKATCQRLSECEAGLAGTPY